MLKLITVLAFCTVAFACITPRATPTPPGPMAPIACEAAAIEKGVPEEEWRLLRNNPFDLSEEDDAKLRAMFQRAEISEWCGWIIDFPDP